MEPARIGDVARRLWLEADFASRSTLVSKQYSCYKRSDHVILSEAKNLG
jgi:hypothetical protein